MNIPSTDSEVRERRELLRELFVNALSLAFLKDLVLSPALVPVRVESEEGARERRGQVPEYYRG